VILLITKVYSLNDVLQAYLTNAVIF